MKLLKFENYEDYKSTQVAANKLKFKNVFAEESELRSIAGHHMAVAGAPRFGLCHGVRNGYEVELLRRLTGGDIQGTDISETAADVPHCFVWDMHEVKPEWSGKVDFIYSNSWDHSYDPNMMFGRWADCLSADGRMYLTWTAKHSDEGVTEDSRYDAFGCSLDELVGILREWLVLENLLVTEDMPIAKQLRKRLGYLRTGRPGMAFGRTVKRHRMITLCLSKR